MKKDIRKQYNNFALTFSENHNIGENSNDKNRLHFYSIIESLPFTKNMKVLDLACGDGYDTNIYQKNGFDVSGIDASKAMIDIAKNKYKNINFNVGLAENLPYEKDTFDIITSKYAIMTSLDMEPIFNEVHRTLKKDGYFIYLATHPFRQYFEKRDSSSDYFHQSIVTSNILNNSVSLQEPSHTFNEFLSVNFLNKFDIVQYEEAFDPAAERIDNRIYPGYFVIVCKKR